MARFFRAQVELERDTTAAADRTVTNWYIQSNEAGTEADDLADIQSGLVTFYEAVDVFLSRELSGAWRVKIYDMEEPEPRIPLVNVTPTNLVVGASALPSQVSLVCNFEATFISGEPPARARGRHFQGPITQVDQDLVGESGASTTIVNGFGNAYAALIPAWPTPLSASDLNWCIFSRRNALDVMGLPYEGPTSQPDQWTVPALTSGYRFIQRVRIPNVYGVQRKRRVKSGVAITQFT